MQNPLKDIDESETLGFSYTPSLEDLKRVENECDHHTPIAELNQAGRYESNRKAIKRAMRQLLHNGPTSREMSLAMTHLRKALFFANAAIACNEPTLVQKDYLDKLKAGG